jgi:Fe-S-cluster containining protein
MTDSDLRRIVDYTGISAKDVVKWIGREGIDLPGEPESFVMLRGGRRVMVLRHQQGHCRFLGADNRCTIYEARPLGCRIFPFDPDFNRKGKLIRLRLIQATDCLYEKDGSNNVSQLRSLHRKTEAELEEYRRHDGGVLELPGI